MIDPTWIYAALGGGAIWAAWDFGCRLVADRAEARKHTTKYATEDDMRELHARCDSNKQALENMARQFSEKMAQVDQRFVATAMRGRPG